MRCEETELSAEREEREKRKRKKRKKKKTSMNMHDYILKHMMEGDE